MASSTTQASPSTPSSTTAQDVGSTFYTKDSAVLKYLEALSPRCSRAKSLLNLLTRETEQISPNQDTAARFNSAWGKPRVQSVAGIVDLNVKGQVRQRKYLMLEDIIRVDTRALAVNGFLNVLRSSQEDDNTRILLLKLERGAFYKKYMKRLPQLLHFHLLAIELDLSLSQIEYFLHYDKYWRKFMRQTDVSHVNPSLCNTSWLRFLRVGKRQYEGRQLQLGQFRSADAVHCNI